MIIRKTINNPVSWEALYFSKDSMTLFTIQDIKEKYGQKVLDLLETEWEVKVIVNAQPLIHKFKKKNGRK